MRHSFGSKVQFGKHSPVRKSAPLSQGQKFFRDTCKSFLCTVGVGGLSLFLVSLGIYFLKNPNPVILPASLVCLAFTAFAGGFISGLIHRHAPAVCGLLNAALLIAVLIPVSLCFRTVSQGYPVWFNLLLHSSVPLLSFLGAIAGVHRSLNSARKPHPVSFRRK